MKNIAAQNQVEWWEEEDEMETTLLKKIIQYKIQWEIKKMNTYSWPQ
jgi:hypothetical protein